MVKFLQILETLSNSTLQKVLEQILLTYQRINGSWANFWWVARIWSCTFCDSVISFLLFDRKKMCWSKNNLFFTFNLPKAELFENCDCFLPGVLPSTVSCLLMAPVSLTGWADSDLLDLDEALLEQYIFIMTVSS